MGSCQNKGPFLGALNRCRIIIGTQKGTLILTTTHILRLLGPKTPASVPKSMPLGMLKTLPLPGGRP